MLILVLAFTAVADAQWEFSETRKDVRELNKVLQDPAGSGTSAYRYAYATGGSTASVQAMPARRGSSSHRSTSIDNWRRKRCDWKGCGNPTEVTANVSITITPQADASGSVNSGSGSAAHGYARAYGYASQSGGTPDRSASGHAQVSVTLNRKKSLTWSVTLSKSAPSASLSMNGTGKESLDESNSGNAMIGGGLRFSKSGAQIYASTSASVRASQANDSRASANAISSVDSFIFDIP